MTPSYVSKTYGFREKKVADIKLEIQTLFPQYWVFITTSHTNGKGFQDSSGRHYHFTTLTALDSHYFPSATSLTLHPGTSKGPKHKRQPISTGRVLALTTKTKDGGVFNVINLYQFTADKTDEREQIWKIISDWISKHPNERTILIGDFNCSGQCDRWGYVLPLHKSLSSADEQLRDFCEKSGGQLTSPPRHTWSRDGHKAVLDHAVTWNMALTSPKVDHLGESHKNYDHGRTSFGLPPEDFLRRSTPARDFTFLSDKVDVIHFHTNLSEWQRRVGNKISPFALDESVEDGDSIMERMTADQEVLRSEALNMQLKMARAK